MENSVEIFIGENLGGIRRLIGRRDEEIPKKKHGKKPRIVTHTLRIENVIENPLMASSSVDCISYNALLQKSPEKSSTERLEADEMNSSIWIGRNDGVIECLRGGKVVRKFKGMEVGEIDFDKHVGLRNEKVFVNITPFSGSSTLWNDSLLVIARDGQLKILNIPENDIKISESVREGVGESIPENDMPESGSIDYQPFNVKECLRIPFSEKDFKLDMVGENGRGRYLTCGKVLGNGLGKTCMGSEVPAWSVAVGGKDVDLRVVDLERMVVAWRARNVANNHLDVAYDVWPSMIDQFPDNPSLLAYSSMHGYVRVYDTRAGRRPTHFCKMAEGNDRDSPLLTLSVVQDGNSILTSANDGSISLLDWRASRVLRRFKVPSSVRFVIPYQSGFSCFSLDQYLTSFTFSSSKRISRHYLRSIPTALAYSGNPLLLPHFDTLLTNKSDEETQRAE